MKRFLLILACLLCCFATDAQERYKAYCSIMGGQAVGSNAVSDVRIDYGQENQRRNYLVDEAGKRIDFPTMVAAMNYMAKRGWALEQTYVVRKESTIDNNHDRDVVVWILCKEVESDDEILEGLATGRTYK